MDARYVYGIVRSETARDLAVTGVEDRPVERVEHGPVAALVSEAPDGPVKASRRNLLAHTEVLQRVAADHCVLPMQFGMVMPSEAGVADELLAAREDALVEQLTTFHDVVEVDLKVVCPEEKLLRAVVAERPELAELRESLRDRSPDATYFERIRLGELIAGAVEEKRSALLDGVLGRLEPHALSKAVSEPAHEQMLVNVAFLVARERLEEFDTEVDALARDLGPDLISKYVGPLPPFHFVETGSAAWA
jgi:hypothetical protein